MASPGTDPEAMLARMTAVSLAVQALVGRLAHNGVLAEADLRAMRQVGLDLVAGLRAHGATGAQVGADRLEREITAWWDVAGTPGLAADGS